MTFVAVALLGLAALVVGAVQTTLPVINRAPTVDGANLHLVHVAPQVAGRVLRVHVGDDQPVQAGALLVELDPEDFAAALVQASARVGEARGLLDQARWQLVLAKTARTVAAASLMASQDRARDAADERTAEVELIVARTNLIAAEAQVNLVRAQIQTTAAGVVAAQAAAARAEIRLSHTKIYAPRTGRVRIRSVEPGDYAHVGQELLALGSDDRGSPDSSRQRSAPSSTAGGPYTEARHGAPGRMNE